MKIIVNVARLEIGQLFTQGTRRGLPCPLDTFLVFVCKFSLSVAMATSQIKRFGEDDMFGRGLLNF